LRVLIKNENLWIFPIVLLFIIINALLIYKGHFWLNFLPFVILILFFAIFSLDTLMFIIIALVPLSIPLSKLIHGINSRVDLPVEPIVAGIMILFFIKIIYNESFDKRILKHPITLAISFNLAWILISCVTSTMPVISIKFFLSRLWFVVVFYFIATQFFAKYQNTIKYIWFYSFSMVVVIVYFLIRLNIEGLTNQLAANWVVEPFYNDHTAYAAALCLLIPNLIGIFFIKKKTNFFIKFLQITLILFYLMALVLSYSRAAWLSLVLALGFFFGMFLGLRLRFMFLIIGVLVGLFFIFKTEIIIGLERNKQDSSNNLSKHIKSISNINSDASNMERINRWNCAMRMFKDKPVFGFGPGTYMFKYAPYQVKSEKTIISTNEGNGGNAHSEYLGPLSESGLFGFLSFLAIVITTMYTASKIYFKTKRRKVKILAISLLVGLFSYYLHGAMNNFLDTDKLSALFWGFTAMIVALDVYHSPKLADKD